MIQGPEDRGAAGFGRATAEPSSLADAGDGQPAGASQDVTVRSRGGRSGPRACRSTRRRRTCWPASWTTRNRANPASALRSAATRFRENCAILTIRTDDPRQPRIEVPIALELHHFSTGPFGTLISAVGTNHRRSPWRRPICSTISSNSPTSRNAGVGLRGLPGRRLAVPGGELAEQQADVFPVLLGHQREVADEKMRSAPPASARRAAFGPRRSAKLAEDPRIEHRPAADGDCRAAGELAASANASSARPDVAVADDRDRIRPRPRPARCRPDRRDP